MRKKKYLALALAAPLLVLPLAGCGGGNNLNKQETKSFSSGKEGKSAGVLPSWVPDDATDIKEVIRTTGDERILAMKNTPIPDKCTAVPTGEKPQSQDDWDDSSKKGENYVTDSASLTADWWPQGVETKATNICGRWWVIQQGDTTYAYAPELKAIKGKIDQTGRPAN